VSALAAGTAAASAVVLVLPAPVVSSTAAFAARAGDGGAIGVPGSLAGDSGSPAQLSRAGSTSSRIRVGGYLGFAGSLNTALRGGLGTALVMQVRAQRPSYWVGETFDTWQGESWTEPKAPSGTLRGGSPFFVPVSVGDVPLGQSDLQTFYVSGFTADLVFHAESASELWFPTSKVYDSDDGTIVSPIGLGSGSVYTVESQVTAPTAAELRSDFIPDALPAATQRADEELPHSYPRVQALAESVTAGDASTYDKVQALIGWIGRHTRYSIDIPPLPAGADTVDEFLFGNRTGYCEQISTALAVMLRTLDIPVREVVGYVPGSYNPVTDLYTIEADDAHAWIQVWIPGYGWQSFDPTASVPLANPDPGATALHDIAGALGGIPIWPAAVFLVVIGLAVVVVRWARRRPATWAEQVALTVERAGRRAGRPRRTSETFLDYATALDLLLPDASDTCRRLAADVEASVYGGREPPPDIQRLMLHSARRIRIRRRRAAAAGAPPAPTAVKGSTASTSVPV
jgi:transglutaminase-like putative cysteine protease